MSDIFISYASQDRPKVQLLAKSIEDLGWSTFWDRQIPTGKTWRQVIGKELREARCVIVLWSKVSIDSTWVQEEADDGNRRNILLPVLIDKVMPPIGFRSIQAVDLSDWDVTEQTTAFQRLVMDIRTLIGSSTKELDEERVGQEDQSKEDEKQKEASEATAKTSEKEKVQSPPPMTKKETEKERKSSKAKTRAERKRQQISETVAGRSDEEQVHKLSHKLKKEEEKENVKKTSQKKLLTRKKWRRLIMIVPGVIAILVASYFIFFPYGFNEQHAFILAARNGDVQHVKRLMKRGIDINFNTEYDGTALIIAVKEGHDDLAEALIEAGALLDYKELMHGETALMKASVMGNTKIVNLLIKSGADLNIMASDSKGGFTALMYAALKGHADIVQILIDAGADINITDDYGQTVLQMVKTPDFEHRWYGRVVPSTSVIQILKDAEEKEKNK